MTKTGKNTVKCIAVLASVALVSVVLIFGLNALLPPKTSFFDRAKLEKICPASDYTHLTSEDFLSMEIDLDEFNSSYVSAKVRGVIKASGGINDGNFIIEAQGAGYGNAPVILYIAYDGGGKIIGVTDLAVDAGNTYWKSNVAKHLDDVYGGLIGKSGDVGSGKDLINVSTGATSSMNAIAAAVNISNGFIKVLHGQNTKVPEEVPSSSLLNQLRAITSSAAVFTKYPFAKAESVNGFGGAVVAVYVSDAGDIVFETSGNGGSYGYAVLLVSVDITEERVVKVYPRQMDCEDFPEDDVFSSMLFDSEKLTEIFGGLDIAEVNALGRHLNGSTGATHTADGLKTAVKMSLKNIDAFMSEWGDYFGGNEDAE